jgi:hypothetical protein
MVFWFVDLGTVGFGSGCLTCCSGVVVCGVLFYYGAMSLLSRYCMCRGMVVVLGCCSLLFTLVVGLLVVFTEFVFGSVWLMLLFFCCSNVLGFLSCKVVLLLL